MSKIQIINPIEYRGWDDLILSTQDYSFFHSSTWAKVLSESYGCRPIYFSIIDNGRLIASIPVMEIKSILTGKRGVSLPFTDYCEPIISADIPYKGMLDFISTYGKKRGWKYIEFKGAQGFFEKEEPSEEYFGHTLDLSVGAEKIFSQFSESTRRNIKKAEREGVEVALLTSLDSVREFYRLNCITRKYHGLPPQPFYFFKSLFDHIIFENLGLIVLAFFQHIVIAGAVFFHFGGKVLYKYGASDKNFHHLRPNNLVMWEGIKWYCKNRYKSFCFGRTELGNQGLRQFKTGWGAREHKISYYKYDLTKGGFIPSSTGMTPLQNKILSKTPIPLLKIIGRLLYKHVA